MISIDAIKCNRCNKNSFKKAIQKTAEGTGDLIRNKSADKITSISKKKKSSTELLSRELPSNEPNNEIPKERYISLQERQIIDDNTTMEYQKMVNLIDDASNQLSKFRTKNWVEINDESRGTYNVNSQIKFKTTMLKSSLCDYSDAYILVKGTISVNNTAAADANANNTNKKIVFKNCAPFTSEVNNTQVDNAKDIDVARPM